MAVGRIKFKNCAGRDVGNALLQNAKRQQYSRNPNLQSKALQCFGIKHKRPRTEPIMLSNSKNFFRCHQKQPHDVSATASSREVDEFPVLDSFVYHKPSSLVALTGTHQSVHSVIFVPQHSTIISASYDGVVRFYDLTTNGVTSAVFENYNSAVLGLAQVDDDLIALVGELDRLVVLWRVSSRQEISRWKHNYSPTAVAALDASHILVGDSYGGIVVLSHKNGTALKPKKRFTNVHSDSIRDITVHRQIVATCSTDDSISILDVGSFKLLAKLNCYDTVRTVTMNDQYIVAATSNGNLSIFRNASGFPIIQILSYTHKANDIQFLDLDVLAIIGAQGIFDFVSVTRKSFVSRCFLSKNSLSSFVVLPDARIAVCGELGFGCVFSPPDPTLDAVHVRAVQLYPSSTIPVLSRNPLQNAWCDVQRGTLSLLNACTTVITPENCKRSLDEWCVAHILLMKAVQSGEIPPSRRFNGINIYWHQVLYQYCSELSIGENDINFLLSMFQEAENAGVIASGGAERLVDLIGVRHDLLKDSSLETDAIYQLFLRQAHTDIRLRQVLHYQKVQHLTALINAIIGCFPIAGGIAANVVTGGASILNDFQVYGLVESLMGSGKEFGTLGSDHLVDRFLRRSTHLLCDDEWDRLSAEQRKAIEDAALNMGLNVLEIKKRFEHATKMQQHSLKPSRTIEIAEIVSCETISESASLISRAEPMSFETSKSIHTQAPYSMTSERTLLNSEVNILEISNETAMSDNLTLSDLITELSCLKNIRIGKSTVKEMDSFSVASALSAFLVLYKSTNAKRFARIRKVLSHKFEARSINGLTFTNSRADVKMITRKVVVNVLSEVVDEEDFQLLSVQLDQFLHLLS